MHKPTCVQNTHKSYASRTCIKLEEKQEKRTVHALDLKTNYGKTTRPVAGGASSGDPGGGGRTCSPRRTSAAAPNAGKKSKRKRGATQICKRK